MASATQKINEIITSLENKITTLRAKSEINVSMRIDKVIPYLEDVLAIAKDDISTRKFDLLSSATGCTIAYTVDGETISAGANVLTYGDELTITVTPNSHYVMSSIKVNGQNFTSGSTITVTTDLNVVAVANLETYDLSITPAEHTTISVKRNNVEIAAGTDVISYGDELRISATAGEGYMITSLNINGTDYVGDQTITVSGDVTITTTATESQE